MESVYQNYRNKTGMNGMIVWEENLKCFVTFLCPLHNFKFGHFTSLSRRGRQRNVPKCKTHVQGVQNLCLGSLSPLFCGVLVAVFVALRKMKLQRQHFLLTSAQFKNFLLSLGGQIARERTL